MCVHICTHVQLHAYAHMYGACMHGTRACMCTRIELTAVHAYAHNNWLANGACVHDAYMSVSVGQEEWGEHTHAHLSRPGSLKLRGYQVFLCVSYVYGGAGLVRIIVYRIYVCSLV